MLVSVIVPCYNQALYLSDALNSLLSQTYTEWEAIIVDDGSPDNTEEIARPFCQSDSRIHYYRKENGGVASARNFGIGKAKGTYILPLDADDMIAPTYIEKAVKAFEKNPSYKMVYCKASFFGGKKKRWNVAYSGYESLLLWNSIFCSAMYRRQDCLDIGGYDESMLLGLEDWEFNIRFLDKQSLVYQIPERLFYYRKKKISRSRHANSEENKLKLQLFLFEKHKEKYFEAFGSVIKAYRKKFFFVKNARRQRLWKILHIFKK